MTDSTSRDFTDPAYWIDRWHAILEGTPTRVHAGYATPGYWDNASREYDTGFDSRRAGEFDTIVSFITGHGLLPEDGHVLDIGCGTGRLAIALARAGARVTALDFSTGMLDKFRENIPEELADRIEIVQADWSALDLDGRGWQNGFDLVCANMTPGVRKPEDFLKMLDASRHGCYLKSWAGRRINEHLERLWERIMGRPMDDRPPDIILEFNLLYAMKRFPSLTFTEVSWQREVPLDDTVTQYIRYFEGIADCDGAELERIIRSELEPLAVDGRITEQSNGRTGMMGWTVG